MWKKGIIAPLVFIGLGMLNFGPMPTIGNRYEPSTESINMDYEPIVVLELFTSQGCSSCPPADVLLQKVKNESEENVFALSYHVDYWNYIGWEDPFSKSEYAHKQREYNIKLRNRSNYTPQVVVNGKEHFVGSNSAKMYDAINRYSKRKPVNKVEILDISVNDNSIGFGYEISGRVTDKEIRAVLVLDQRTTQVRSGENRNRTLTNNNIVVAEKIIGIEEGKGNAFIGIPEIVKPNEKIQLVLLVETDDYDIVAAAKSDLER